MKNNINTLGELTLCGDTSNGGGGDDIMLASEFVIPAGILLGRTMSPTWQEEQQECPQTVGMRPQSNRWQCLNVTADPAN